MSTAYAFAQARLQARNGARLDESSWRALHANTTLSHFVEAARATGLGGWVSHLHAQLGVHEIERSLRRDFAALVTEIASWLPARWRPALLFLRELPSLVGLDDELALSAEARRKWVARFHVLAPRMLPHERATFVVLAKTLDAHLEEMARTARTDADAWTLRARLEAELTRLFRWYPEQPASAFVFVALVLLDLERLRGALVRRALFEDVRSEVAWV